MRKNGIVIRLQGGLGNQLFILAAGIAQARRLDCGLFIDTSLFVEGKSWPIEVTKIKFDGLNLEDDTRIMKPLFGGVLDKFAPSVFEEKSFAFDERIFEITPGTTLSGYFQSEKYFSPVKEEIFNSLASLVFDENEQKVIDELSRMEFIALHMRRGDYVSNPEALKVHGLTRARYFEQAVEMIRRQTGIDKVLVFSDDILAAKNELGHLVGLDFTAVPNNISSFATLALFSYGRGFVISNSTFSWWGAWLGQMRSQGCPVIAPRPWFTSNMPTQDLLPDNWYTLGR